jgi:hypothetical protein
MTDPRPLPSAWMRELARLCLEAQRKAAPAVEKPGAAQEDRRVAVDPNTA